MDKTPELLWDTINRIDDFLEYRYKGYTKEEMRSEILKMIEDMTKQMRRDME